MSEVKKITKEQYLQAFALFTMAHQHNAKSVEFADGLAQVLGMGMGNDLNHLSDAIWGDRDPFDVALKREGFEVEE